ncbi:MAG: phosphoribosylamine--glycine ligase [bacterium]|nr:phosphoribosylamine--glycine ligase [bacterium]
MKVLVIGSGGREHTLCWKLSQDRRVKKIYCVSGNAGISQIAECVDIKIGQPDYFGQLAKLVTREKIDLTLVGPEIPLAEGITDYFKKLGLSIFGPTKDCALLEGSKIFAKEFMRRHNIPTPEFEIFNNVQEAINYLKSKKPPFVIKADGLATGKGVIICKTVEEGIEAIKKIMEDKIFGEAGNKIIIDEFQAGEEVSILAWADGKTVLPMVSSQDHKSIFDGDKGPNTGGMGAYSPAPVITNELMARIQNEILTPTIQGLAEEGREYVGVIYSGLIIVSGKPLVLEYNCRFGDPETQVVLPRLKTDLTTIIEACFKGRLSDINIEWDERATLCVVLASAGYPDDYKKGLEIFGLEDAQRLEDTIVFHAGTTRKDNKILTAGGRVVGVTAYGDSIKQAKEKAYLSCGKIDFEGIYYRQDIGYRALEKLGRRGGRE